MTLRKRLSHLFVLFSVFSLLLPIPITILLLGPLQAAAIDKGDLPSYLREGKVLSVRVDEHTDCVPISPPDSKGRTHGGQSFVSRKQVYRVDTGDEIYELEGGKNPTMAVGDVAEFRIVKGNALVRTGKKEKKYRVISATPTTTAS